LAYQPTGLKQSVGARNVRSVLRTTSLVGIKIAALTL
jgi:hypothetical protein